jgi:hypothetical protein
LPALSRRRFGRILKGKSCGFRNQINVVPRGGIEPPTP